MTVHSAGDGISWGDTETLDINQPHGLDYRQSNHIAIAVRKRLNHEHTAFADATVGGVHVPGKVALLDIVDQTIDISIADSTYHGSNLIYDQTTNAFWCFTNTDGTASTPAAFLLKTHPDRAWGGGDVTWTGTHEFSDVGVKGDFSVDGTAIFDATGIEFGGTPGIGLFYDPTSQVAGESVRFPNGLIFKTGIISASVNPQAIAFAANFPTGVISCFAVAQDASPVSSGIAVDNLSVSGFNIRSGEFASISSYYWQAWGY